MVRWWVLVHHSPDGAQSNFSCGYWVLVESQMNGITHVFIHSVVPNLFTHPYIHPSIYPTRIIRTLAMGTFGTQRLRSTRCYNN
jgi:hypothetical protein